MNSVETHDQPATNGPVLSGVLRDLSNADLMKRLVGLSIAVAEQGIAECYGGVRQYPNEQFRNVPGRYPVGETWRDCASPELIGLVETLRTIAGEPAAPRPKPAPSVALTDEAQLTPGASQ